MQAKRKEAGRKQQKNPNLFDSARDLELLTLSRQHRKGTRVDWPRVLKALSFEKEICAANPGQLLRVRLQNLAKR